MEEKWKITCVSEGNMHMFLPLFVKNGRKVEDFLPVFVENGRKVEDTFPLLIQTGRKLEVFHINWKKSGTFLPFWSVFFHFCENWKLWTYSELRMNETLILVVKRNLPDCREWSTWPCLGHCCAHVLLSCSVSVQESHKLSQDD